MSYLTDKNFWVAAAELAVRTLAKGSVGFLLADNFNVLAPDWKSYFYVAVVPALASVLLSISSGASPVGGKGSPLLTKNSPEQV